MRRFCSHPDLNGVGALSVYAELAAGGQGVVLLEAGALTLVARTSDALARIGPAGPTMNRVDDVAVLRRAVKKDADRGRERDHVVSRRTRTMRALRRPVRAGRARQDHS